MNYKSPIPHSQLSAFLQNDQSRTKEDETEVLTLGTSLHTEICRIEESLTGTLDSTNDKSERYDALKSSLSPCAVILPPSRCVPKEIWGEIFLHCLSTDRHPTVSYKEAPLLLTRVCALWKDVALSTPYLWTRIHIPIPPLPRPSFSRDRHTLPPCMHLAEYHADLSRYTTLIETETHQIIQWLRLAGSLPLQISLWSQDDDLRECSLQYELLQAVFLSFSHNLQHLDLDFIRMDRAVDHSVAIHVDQFPLLESLSIRMVQKDEVSDPTSLLHAPNLRDLTIGSIPIGIFFGVIPTTWSMLQNLTIHCLIDGAATLKLLAHCQCLVHCSLAVVWYREQDLAGTDGIPVILCPRLEHLTISDPGARDSPGSLFQALYPPNLRYFKWTVDHNLQNLRFRALYRNGHSPNFPINRPNYNAGFLPRLENLETLAIKPNDHSYYQIREFLHSVPSSVTTLIIGDNPSTPKVYPEGFCLTSEWEPGDEVLSELSTPRQLNLSTHRSFLLPNLENIEYNGKISSVKNILNIILTRTTLNPLHGPNRRLKQFTARLQVEKFKKKELQDMFVQIHDYVNLSGIPFKLEIFYAQGDDLVKGCKKIVFDSQDSDSDSDSDTDSDSGSDSDSDTDSDSGSDTDSDTDTDTEV